MNFGFSDDQTEIKRTANELLAKRSALSRVRELAEAGEGDAELWSEIAGLGWPGVSVPEEHGGGGLGLVELASLLEECGYALAATPLLGVAACASAIQEAGSDRQKREWLPRLASGEARGAFAIEGGLVPDAADLDLLVLADADLGSAGLLLPQAAGLEAVESIDPTRRYGRASASAEEGEPLPGDAASAASLAAVLTSAELVGVCQRVLEMTVEYVKERKQFGVPVGSFQAVQHRCAQMLLDTESSRSTTYFAAWAADADRDQLPRAASLAKATASAAGTEVTASAIQAHGGIGFTWEADVHWFYKRAQLDAAFLGGAAAHRARLASLAASGA